MGGKFYGTIGYSDTVEVTPGVWQEQIIERKYTGDILKNVNKWRDGENLNPNLVLENRLSIVADKTAYDNFHKIRFVEWMGAKWRVTAVEVARPRLLLTIGEVYNDQDPMSTTTAP